MALEYNNQELSLLMLDFFEQLEFEKRKIREMESSYRKMEENHRKMEENHRKMEENYKIIDANNETLKMLMASKTGREAWVLQKMQELQASWLANAERIDQLETRVDDLENPAST
jgi:peptidoglycan hydrolase CwlO-like protein